VVKDTKIFLILIAPILLVSLIPNSDATINLENMSLLSDDGNLVIDFGKNIIEQKTSKIKSIPTLEFGIVQTVSQHYFLDFSDNLSVKVYGNSIVVKSFDQQIFIYAQNIGSNNYLINAYTVDNGFKKQSFRGTLEPISGPKTLESEIIGTLPEMKILVKHTERAHWQHLYFITARVFDAELNKFNEFDQNWGYIPGINILVEIFNEDDELLTSLSGQTGNTGYFEAEYYIVENLIPRGDYLVNVTADNGLVQLTKSLPLFILGERAPSGGNSTVP